MEFQLFALKGGGEWKTENMRPRICYLVGILNWATLMSDWDTTAIWTHRLREAWRMSIVSKYFSIWQNRTQRQFKYANEPPGETFTIWYLEDNDQVKVQTVDKFNNLNLCNTSNSRIWWGGPQKFFPRFCRRSEDTLVCKPGVCGPTWGPRSCYSFWSQNMYFSTILSDFCWTFKKIYSKYLLILRLFCAKTLYFSQYDIEVCT